MTLEELQIESDKDLKINDIQLDIESLKIPQLHNKYLKFLNNYKVLLKKSETDLDKMIKHKWEYYTGKSDPDVYKLKPFNLKILRQDVDKYVNADEEIIKLKHKKEYLTTTVNYLEQIIRQINNRTFTIKNAIEWKKFTSGAI